MKIQYFLIPGLIKRFNPSDTTPYNWSKSYISLTDTHLNLILHGKCRGSFGLIMRRARLQGGGKWKMSLSNNSFSTKGNVKYDKCKEICSNFLPQYLELVRRRLLSLFNRYLKLGDNVGLEVGSMKAFVWVNSLEILSQEVVSVKIPYTNFTPTCYQSQNFV